MAFEELGEVDEEEEVCFCEGGEYLQEVDGLGECECVGVEGVGDHLV